MVHKRQACGVRRGEGASSPASPSACAGAHSDADCPAPPVASSSTPALCSNGESWHNNFLSLSSPTVPRHMRPLYGVHLLIYKRKKQKNQRRSLLLRLTHSWLCVTTAVLAPSSVAMEGQGPMSCPHHGTPTPHHWKAWSSSRQVHHRRPLSRCSDPSAGQHHVRCKQLGPVQDVGAQEGD